MRCQLKSLAAFITIALLAGCSSKEPAPAEVAVATPNDRCTSKAADYLVGQQLTPELLEQARQRTGAQVARQLRPTDMVTLEYRSDRLNINTDQNGKILRANCG